MWVLSTLINTASTISWAYQKSKKIASTKGAISKQKETPEWAKQSFKDEEESQNNPLSDYYGQELVDETKIVSPIIWADRVIKTWNKVFKPIENFKPKVKIWDKYIISSTINKKEWTIDDELEKFKKTSILWKQKIDWDSALNNIWIREELKNSANSNISKKYIAEFWLEDYQEKSSRLSKVDFEAQMQRAYYNEKVSTVRDPLSAWEKAIQAVPFIWHLLTPEEVKIKTEARDITMDEGITKRDWLSTIAAQVLWLWMGLWIYSKAESLAAHGLSKMSASWINSVSKIGSALSKTRLTSPKLFSLTTNSMVEFSEYGFRKMTGDENYSKWDLIAWLTLWWWLSMAFWWTAVKSIKDSITWRDLKWIEKLITDSWVDIKNADEAFEVIKDYKLENGYTIDEAQDVISENGKKLLKWKRKWVISSDDVKTSLDWWLNGWAINTKTAQVIADVMNSAKQDIDNAPSWMFTSWTDENATAIMNDIISEFSQKGKVYTTDDASDIIQWIVAKYGKNYKVDKDTGYEIDDLLHDIVASGNASKLKWIKSIDDIYTLAWKKSPDVKYQDIADIQKSLDEYDILLSSTKKWAKVKIDWRKTNAIVQSINNLIEKANYTKEINIFSKDGSIDVSKVKSLLNDIESANFTNSTRFNNRIKDAENLLITTTKGYSKKIATKWVSNIKTWIKSVEKSIETTIQAWHDVVKIMWNDASSYLNKSRKGKAIMRQIVSDARVKIASAKSQTDVKKAIHSAVTQMYIKEAQLLKNQIEKEFSWLVWDASRNANIWSYHWDALNTFIKSYNQFKWDNDVEILRDALEEVKSIRALWRSAVKEFIEERKKDVISTVEKIRKELSDTRIEFDHENNKVAVNDRAFWSSLFRWINTSDYPSRTLVDLFWWTNTEWYKTFYTNFVSAQSKYMAERDFLEKTQRRLMYDAFKWSDIEAWKYRIFSLFRRISKEFSPERAYSFIQDATNIRIDKNGELRIFWVNDTIPTEWFRQLNNQDIKNIVDKISAQTRIKWWNIAKYDKFVQEQGKGIGKRLEDLFRKEYNVNFWQVEDYTKIKYLDWKMEWIDDSMDAMNIFTQPLTQLSKWFSKTTDLRTWNYALDMDEHNIFQSTLNDQLRFLYMKEPLSKATRTLNVLTSWKIWEDEVWLKSEWIDALFKSLWFWDSNRVETDMISQDAYRYIKDYLTLIANNWSWRWDVMDRRVAKFIYAKMLSLNPNTIISQFNSYSQMLQFNMRQSWSATINGFTYDNMHYASELSGYLAWRRSSVLWNEFEEDVIEKTKNLSYIGRKIEFFKWIWKSIQDAWRRTQVDKSYTKLDFAMEAWLSPMKMTDWVVATVAWYQGFEEWARQNNIKLSKIYRLRDIVEWLSPEQTKSMVAFADTHMQKIMGANDVVAWKEFKSSMARAWMVLWKATYNALRQTYDVIWKTKWMWRVGALAKMFILSSLINTWSEKAKSYLAHKSWLKSNADLYPWFLTVMLKRANGWNIDPEIASILDWTSRWLLAFMPAGWPLLNINEFIWISSWTASKIKDAYDVGWERWAEQLFYAVENSLTPSNWASKIANNMYSLARHWKSVIEVQDENYNLSKMDINPEWMSEEKISEAVALNKDIRESKKKSDTIDWLTTAQFRDNLFSNLYDTFWWKVPTPNEFIEHIKANPAEFKKLWLSWDARKTKAFYMDMRIKFSKSAWDVDSVLSSADMDYIFENRLKSYYDKWDKEGYQSELKRLIQKWVIKSPDWYNSWFKKYLKWDNQ